MAAIGMFVGVVGLIICVLLYAVYRNVPDNVSVFFSFLYLLPIMEVRYFIIVTRAFTLFAHTSSYLKDSY